MTIAIDTTEALTPAQLRGLLAADVSCTLRYLAPQAWKRLTPAEAAGYGQTGMQLVNNWENGAKDLRDLDATTTATHARMAVAQAQADGYPAGCWIYNSGADYDVQAGDWARIAANLRIVRPIYRAGGYGIGMYSSWDALTWARRDGLVDGYWQSMSTSFSGGRNAKPLPFAHLRQHGGTTIAGVSCDPSDILIPAFGQAGAMQPILETTMPFLAQTGGKAGDPAGQYYLCDGFRSVPITPQRADLLSYLAVETSGAAIALARSATGDNTEWTSINGRHGTVRMGWGPNFGPVVPDDGGAQPAASVDQAALNAAVAAAVALAGPGLSVADVTAAVVAALGHLHLTVAS